MVYFNSLVFVFECSRFLPLEYKLHEYFVCLVYCSTQTDPGTTVGAQYVFVELINESTFTLLGKLTFECFL